MTDDAGKSDGSWWRTVPGVLTATATIITALTGLLIALHQSGLIGGGDKASPPRPPVEARSDPTARPEPSPPTTSPEPAGKATEGSSTAAPNEPSVEPWSEARAVIVGSEGSVTVRAESLGNCIESAKDLTLNNGQSIPFEKMRSFEFVREGAKSTLVVTLLDGETVKGSMSMGCDLVGRNELGRVSVLFEKVKRVDFQR